MLVLVLTLVAAHRLAAAGRLSVAAVSGLDDLLCLPLLLGGVTLVQRRLPGRDRDWRLPRRQAAAAVVLFALLFEGILPRLSIRYTADPVDVGRYAAGALLFLLWQEWEGRRREVRT